jgi:hypothetical protein
MTVGRSKGPAVALMSINSRVGVGVWGRGVTALVAVGVGEVTNGADRRKYS